MSFFELKEIEVLVKNWLQIGFTRNAEASRNLRRALSGWKETFWRCCEPILPQIPHVIGIETIKYESWRKFVQIRTSCGRFLS